jgi:hypothetical protein
LASIYETYGPFEIKRDGNKLRKEALIEFWKKIDKDYPGLSDAVGVYIFAVKASRRSKSKPWYVGKTDKQGFKRRFKQQLNRFSDVFDSAKNGTPQIFLLARLTPRRRSFMKARSTTMGSNDALESMLIGSCISQNKKLINANKVKHLRELRVPGYLHNGQGKLTKAASELNRMVKAK